MKGAAHKHSSRQAWRAARVRIGDRLFAPLPDHYHGKRSTYSYYGCQCDPCLEAGRQPQRKAASNARGVPSPRRTPKRTSTPEPTAEPARKSPPKAAPKPAPSPEPEPAPEPQPETKRAVADGATALPSDPIPRFNDSAADHVTSRAHFDLVLEAYHRPVIVTGVQDRPDLETRIAEGCLIRVRSETGEVVFVGDAERSSAEPTTLAPTHEPKRRRSGGSGSRMPTSCDEIRRRLRDLGCTLDDSHKHTRVTLPDGRRLQLPKTPSDHRSIRNIVSQYANAGIDLRRQD